MSGRGEPAEKQPPGFLGSINMQAGQNRQAAETQGSFTVFHFMGSGRALEGGQGRAAP